MPIVHKRRLYCDANAHDTRWAIRRYGCKCDSAKEAERQAQRRWYQPTGRSKGRPTIEECAEFADAVMVRRILKREDGPTDAARTYDRQAAALVLLSSGLPAREISHRVGLSVRQVQRISARVREIKRGMK